jgi:hypothetical protein
MIDGGSGRLKYFLNRRSVFGGKRKNEWYALPYPEIEASRQREPTTYQIDSIP